MKKGLIVFLSILMLSSFVYGADITIKIPDNISGDVVDAFSSVYGREEILPDGSQNPETKKQFALRIIKQFIKEVYIAHKVKDIESERQAIIINANDDMVNIGVE